MKHRLLAAAATASVGTVIFLALGAISHGLIGSPLEPTGCFLGAFVSSVLVVREVNRSARRNFLAAVVIVLVTFCSIAAAHAIEQPLIRGVPVDEEWRGLLFWAVVTSSWWLVPGVAYVLAFWNRRLPTAQVIEHRAAG